MKLRLLKPALNGVGFFMGGSFPACGRFALCRAWLSPVCHPVYTKWVGGSSVRSGRGIAEFILVVLCIAGWVCFSVEGWVNLDYPESMKPENSLKKVIRDAGFPNKRVEAVTAIINNPHLIYHLDSFLIFTGFG